MSKILLIDDNADNLTSLSATIKDFIHTSTIFTALSGPEGLKIASAEMPDVIILDIRMPGMNGYEVLELLKANIKTKVIPVILLTANYTDIKSKVRGLETGADAFLSKPIDKNELIAQVKVMQRIKNAEDILRKENILLESVAKDASMKFDFTQRKYQNIFDNNIAGILETTFDGKIINCNTALAKMFGFKNIEEVFEHETLPFYKHTSDREKIISFLKRNNELINYEVEFVDKNGKTIDALIRCFNIGGQSILSFLIDITNVKRLQEKQHQYEHIVSSSTDMIALLDKNFTYLASNAALLEAFGKTSEELIGFTAKDVFGKEHFETVIKPYALRCLSGKVINYQKWLDFPIRGKRYVDVSYFPYKDKQNKIKGFVVNARDITERKLTEEALQLREQQLSLIYDSTGDVLYYLEVEPGPNYRFLTVNSAFLKATGLNMEQIVGKTINEVIPEPSLKLVRSNYEKAIREKKIVNWEETSQYPAGLKTGIISIAPVFDDKDNCTHLVGSVHDITERKQAEKELQESYNIINRSPAVVFLWKNAEGWPIEYVSKNVKDLFGYTAEEFLSGNVSYDSVVQQEDLKKAIEKTSIYKEDKKENEYTQEYRIITKDGKIKWVEDRTFIRRNEKDEITHFQGIVLDTTERKQAEEKLRHTMKELDASKKRLKTIIETEPECVKILNINGKLLDMNRAGLDMIEADSLDQVRERDIFPIIAPEYRKAFRKMLKNVIHGNKEIIVFKIIGLKGTHRWLETYSVPLYNAENEIIELLGVTRDITRRKKDEDEIKQKNKQLLLLSKASTEINKVLDIKIILQQLVKIAIELTDSTSGAAALYEDDKMVFKTYNDEGKITPINFKFEKGYGVSGWVLKTKKPYITNDAENDKHVIQKIRGKFNFHKLINVPIFNKEGELLGCFTIHNTKEGRSYNENDIEILQGLAANTSVAIENSQMLLERKQAEIKIKESRQRLSSHLTNTPLGAIFWDVDFKVTDWNKSAENIFGYSKEEALGKHANELIIPKETQDKVKDVFNQLLAQTGGKRNTNKNITKEGKKILCDWYNVAITDLNGKVTGVASLIDDITEKRIIEEKLQSQKDFNDVLIQSTPAFFVAIQENGKVLMMNDTMLKALGYSKQEVLGKDYLCTFVPESDREMLSKIFEKLTKLPQPTLNENYILAKDGHKILTEWHGVPIFKDKKIDYFIGLGIDITRRKKNEDEIKQKNKQLLLLSKASTEINKVLDIKIILRQLVKIAIELTGSTSGAAALYEDNKMVFKTYNVEGKITPIDFKFEKGYGVPGWIIETKEPYISNDAKNDKHVIPEIREALNFHQLIDVPILNKNGELLGCFEIHNTKDNRLYNENDIEILKGLAANTSVAIENAQMILERKKAEEILSFERDKFSFMLNSLPIGVTVLDSDDKYIFINSISLKIDGVSYDPLSLMGENVRSNHSKKESLLEIEKLINDFKSGKETYQVREASRGKRTVQISYHALHNPEGKYTGLIRLISDITERKEAESLILLQSSAMQSAPNAIIITDKSGNIEWCNRAFTKMTGFNIDESLGKNVRKLIDFDTTDKDFYKDINDAVNSGKIWKGEFKNKHKDGSILYTETIISPFYDKVKNQTKFITVKQDITEQRKSEIALKKSELHYRYLFNGLNDLVLTHDLEGIILSINPKAVNQLGYKKEEMLNKKFSEFLVPEVKDEFKDYLTKIKKEGKAKGFMLVMTRTGEKRIWEYNNSLVKIDNEEKFISSIARDVTDAKKAQHEILKLSRGIEQSPAMVVITDTDGNIEFINPKVTEFTGYYKEELIGKNPRIFQSGKTPKNTYKELWNTILKGGTWEGEILNKRKNGEMYWESERVSPIFNDKGEIINFLSIKVDITENIKARNELIKAKEEAEESSRIKSIFLANMSHELRTPMVGIMGFTEILEKEIENPEQKEYASFIHGASTRLMETLNLILNLTKIEAEKINVELSKIDIINNIKRTVSIFDKTAGKKNLYLKFESDIEKFETETDERMFDQIISNLVNNAVKYTEKGGITVSVNKIRNDTYLEIKVKDTGIGIPKDKQEIIWEDFRQVSEGTSRVYEGTGLGLTITNKFVNKLGGEIKLESEAGKDSTFTVLLPIQEKSIPKKTEQLTFDETIKTPKTKDTQEELKHLLFVDDDKITREVIKIFLKGYYKVDLAENGPEAIGKAKKKKYDCILMDINLKSKISGIEAAEKIKEMEEYKEAPIIAVTANAMVGDRGKYLEAGFTDYMSKPFSKNDIIELLNKTIK